MDKIDSDKYCCNQFASAAEAEDVVRRDGLAGVWFIKDVILEELEYLGPVLYCPFCGVKVEDKEYPYMITHAAEDWL